MNQNQEGLDNSLEYETDFSDWSNEILFSETMNQSFNPSTRYVFYIIYTFIFVLGIFGNALVCFSLFRSKTMRKTITNVYIGNIAFADILWCLSFIPFIPTTQMIWNDDWIFGKALCHMVPYFCSVSIYVSALSFTSIAVERLKAIVYSAKPGNSRINVIFIWIFALWISIPHGLFSTIEYLGDHVRICYEKWPLARVVNLVSILQFGIPFVIISICYMIIAYYTGTNPKKRMEEKKQLVMLIIVTSVYGICWFPINTLQMMSLVTELHYDWKHIILIFTIAQAITGVSSCIKPLLYIWLSESFRNEFKKMLGCWKNNRKSLFNNNHKENGSTSELLMLNPVKVFPKNIDLESETE